MPWSTLARVRAEAEEERRVCEEEVRRRVRGEVEAEMMGTMSEAARRRDAEVEQLRGEVEAARVRAVRVSMAMRTLR